MLELLLITDKRAGFSYRAMASSNVAASHRSAIIHNQKIYVAGGLNSSITSIVDFTCYDIVRNTWTTLANLPAISRGGAMAAVDNQIIYFGGFAQGGSGLQYNTIWIYNISLNQWTVSTSKLPLNLVEAAAVVHENKLYLFGGTSSSKVQDVVLSTALGGYTFTFNNMAAMPNAARAMTALKVGSSAYLIGGVRSDATYSDEFLRYDFVTNTYVALAPIPMPGSYINLYARKGSIYALVSHNGSSYKNHLYEYNVATNTWSDGGENENPVHALTPAVAVKEGFYVVGGYNPTEGRLTRTAKYTKF